MNSPGGYVYVLYGEDSFGRDEAVHTLKERMRALPAGEHNLTELGPETSVATLRLAADVVPFLADRRMVLVRGLLGRLAGRGGAGRRPARGRKSAPSDTGVDEFQLLLDYLPDLPQTTSLVLVEDGRLGLNRPAKDYLPELSGDGIDEVLVHHLLTHTSGYMWHTDPPMMEHLQKKIAVGFEPPPCRLPGRKHGPARRVPLRESARRPTDRCSLRSYLLRLQ